MFVEMPTFATKSGRRVAASYLGTLLRVRHRRRILQFGRVEQHLCDRQVANQGVYSERSVSGTRVRKGYPLNPKETFLEQEGCKQLETCQIAPHSQCSA